MAHVLAHLHLINLRRLAFNFFHVSFSNNLKILPTVSRIKRTNARSRSIYRTPVNHHKNYLVYTIRYSSKFLSTHQKKKKKKLYNKLIYNLSLSIDFTYRLRSVLSTHFSSLLIIQISVLPNLGPHFSNISTQKWAVFRGKPAFCGWNYIKIRLSL